ncbi:tRNA pseudouridine(55) synthase TruB [Sphingorhabdus arenilitoris]|uniref:tRNA pseudouridine synthase B n=1 Tax=Sphingorhabdus arenilitoris TaxID=1490041 RepID=A0ABV8RGB3_9SPHN
MSGINGWIILDKPLGLGSTQAVAAVKRNLRSAGYGKLKVGHGGTLDPLATGVLPVALGEATKLCGRMLDASKIYDFTIHFGNETAGLDAEGEVVATSDVRPTLAQIQTILPQFTGVIEQIPPAFSAIKIDGKRAYDLARAGEAVQMKSREVTIYSLRVSPPVDEHQITMQGTGDAAELAEVRLTAHVSKGTYIRSLARDIAHAAGTVGHVTMLRRVKAGPFSLESAISLDKLNEIGEGAAANDFILPFEAGLDDIPVLDLSPDAVMAVRQGRVVTGIATDDGLYWARDAEMRPVAMIELFAGTLKIVRGFNI